MFDSSQKIGGEGKIVQIDESKFGKPENITADITWKDNGYLEGSRRRVENVL